jgi:hypothetical protein
MKLIGVLAGTIVIAACGADATAVDVSALDGAWTARSFGVTEQLDLRWTADSVVGSGTYFVIDNSIGCGGATLQGNGHVTFHAGRSGTAITGFMVFDNGWTPPYTGTLEDNARIAGSFRSIDAGSCSFDLIHGLIP